MATWSGLWNYVYNEPYSQIDSKHFRQQLREGMRNYRIPYNRLISAIVQGVGNAYGDYHRVAVQDINDIFGTLGGKRPAELKVVINRAPTAQDNIDIRFDLYNVTLLPPGVGADKSGNGSGGMAFSKGL